MELVGSMFKVTANTDVLKKLPSPLFKIAAQTFIDKEFPRHIFVETTSACQLSCEYCPREKRNEHMDFELFKNIIDEGTHYGPRSWSLHLFGEPLLYPRILDAIKYIKSKNKNHTILLTTNGILLNRFIDELVSLKVDKIIWSWRRNNFTGETIQVLKKIGLVRLLIEETPKEEFEKWKTFPRVEIKSLHNYGGNIDVSKWGIQESSLPERYPCYHLWLAPAVRWNGEITFCCNIPTLGHEVLSKYPESSIQEAWKSERLKEIRQEHLNKVYKGACKNCTSWQAYPSIF